MSVGLLGPITSDARYRDLLSESDLPMQTPSDHCTATLTAERLQPQAGLLLARRALSAACRLQS